MRASFGTWDADGGLNGSLQQVSIILRVAGDDGCGRSNLQVGTFLGAPSALLIPTLNEKCPVPHEADRGAVTGLLQARAATIRIWGADYVSPAQTNTDTRVVLEKP